MTHRIAPRTNVEQKAPRRKSNTHLDYIRALPCVICLAPSEACHVRLADALYGTHTGGGRKPDDSLTVPMCREHHTQQHSDSEREFWAFYNIDPLAMALALHRVSPDVERGCKIVMAWREWGRSDGVVIDRKTGEPI